jgi:hypothetical protein
MWILVLVPFNINNELKIGFDFQNQFWNWNPKWNQIRTKPGSGFHLCLQLGTKCLKKRLKLEGN